jgi:hypothetical protein
MRANRLPSRGMIPGDRVTASRRVIEGRNSGGARLTVLAVGLCVSKFQRADEFQEAGASLPGSQTGAWEPVNFFLDYHSATR